MLGFFNTALGWTARDQKEEMPPFLKEGQASQRVEFPVSPVAYPPARARSDCGLKTIAGKGGLPGLGPNPALWSTLFTTYPHK